jgi:hypothetical protein
MGCHTFQSYIAAKGTLAPVIALSGQNTERGLHLIG